MKLLLCFILCLLIVIATSAKTIKIQIDPDDILKIMDGVMNSNTFKNFASQLVQRGAAKQVGYNNPYHPEDDLVNSFDDAVNEEKESLKKSIKHNKLPLKLSIDPLDKENEQFLDGNDVANEADILTDEMGEPILKAKNDTKNIIDAVASKKILTRKDGRQEYIGDDTENSKPLQTRYVLKGSDDSKT